ncbi:MAG: AAA family ATPase, partial [Ruminococcus sp.]|nr:AAA family ATPase [Ruminococcus sp.]
NMATVESAEAGFSPGLNVLTGETGAGKSVVAGAIAFAAGAKAGKSIVRDGAKEARVEAVFELRGAAAERVRSVLDGAGVSTGCDDGESDAGIRNGFLRMAVVRTVGSSGGGRAWINNTPATVQTLAKAGAMLVDVHGAGANGLVKDESFRRRAIDACGDVPAGSYKAACLIVAVFEVTVAAFVKVVPLSLLQM